MINLFISQYYVTKKLRESLLRTDFGKSAEKTSLLTEDVGNLWGIQLGSVQRGRFLLPGLFSASVELSDIVSLPIFAMDSSFLSPRLIR